MAGEEAFTEVPDTVPDDFVLAYGAGARRTVVRSRRAQRIAALEVRLAKVAMVIAAIALLAAVVFLMTVLPMLGIPLAAVLAVVGVIVLVEWLLTGVSSSRRRRPAGPPPSRPPL